MTFTREKYDAMLEKAFRPVPRKIPADLLHISSGNLTMLLAGEYDDKIICFSNGCIFRGRALREMLQDTSA